MVSSAAAAAASEAKGKEEERREGPGVLGRIWRALFGGRGEDYEKRLRNLSKEEAAVLARMGRRAHFSRRGVRNLIAVSVLGEVSPRFASLRVTSVKSDARMRLPGIRCFGLLTGAARLWPMFRFACALGYVSFCGCSILVYLYSVVTNLRIRLRS